MYRRLLMVACAISFCYASARANDILAITETGESFNDLVVTYNNAPLAISLSGTADAWTVQLPTGYTFGSGVIGGGTFLVEPDNSLLFDQINIPTPLFLTWISDIPLTGITAGQSFTFTDAGRGPGGGNFDLVLNAGPNPGVPDAGATMMLFAGALGALKLVSRRLH